MPRGLDSAQKAALKSGRVGIAILCKLSFLTYTVCLWSGLGPYVYAGDTYTGVGILGKISPIQESNQILATGMTLTLSGISQADLELPDLQANMALTNIATVSMLLMDATGAMIGPGPITSFTGYMGQATLNEDPSGSSVTIEIETKLAQLNRPKFWRYCLTDMKYWNPTEDSFDRTVYLADFSERFGT